MLGMVSDTQAEVAATAARMVVEEGMEYGPAKRRAAKSLGLQGRAALPDNELMEAAVREYISLFCADTQPQELRALRALALVWMERLQEFRPHLSGAVWHGTATKLSDIYLQLFCDDPKSAELALIDKGVNYEVNEVAGLRGDMVPALSLRSKCVELNEMVGVHLLIYDHDQLRGALKTDNQGRTPRGSISALQSFLTSKEDN
jgi:hypothetical protein